MIQTVKGTKDILPQDISLWNKIESSARTVFSLYGYQEIKTPILEETSLFIRSIGEDTDIVQKEMFVFSDRGERSICLRPEATASIVRAYLNNSLSELNKLTKLFYIGPMFRSEKPQKGRQRQFHQVGVEAIGSRNPFLDVEVISLSIRLLQKLNIGNFDLRLNSLGCQKDKSALISRQKEVIKPYLESLCNECKKRYGMNVLRIFDCKNEGCREVVRDIKFGDFLCEDCEKDFGDVQKGLDKLGISYTLDLNIVRGLDYYTKTVFEIIQKDLGAKDAICAGGRYNNLIKEMGGEETSAIGFAFGVERLIIALEKKNNQLIEGFSLDVFLAIAGETSDLFDPAFILMDSLRQKGITSDIDYEKKSLKSQMRKAEKLNARFVIIFGEEEYKKGTVVLRDMQKSSQKEVGLKDIVGEIASGR